MKLTQSQESLVTRYLRDVAMQLDQELPEAEREQGLAQLQRRIDRDLQGLNKDALDDADVEAVLERMGAPARHAAMLSPRRDPRRMLLLSRDNVIWLGVCSGVATRMDLEPWVVRVLSVLIGIVSGPVAVLAYIGLYLFMRKASGRVQPLDTLRIAGRGAAAFLIPLALHIGSGYLLRLIFYVHEEYLKQPVPDIGQWDWLEASRDEYFFYAFMTAVPLAVLSAMPLAKGWDYTIKRMSQACIALYGIALSFGIASFVVGIILEFVQDFSK